MRAPGRGILTSLRRMLARRRHGSRRWDVLQPVSPGSCLPSRRAGHALPGSFDAGAE